MFNRGAWVWCAAIGGLTLSMLPACDDGIRCLDCREDGGECPPTCRPPCQVDEDCEAQLGTGHRCVEELDGLRCSAECDPTRCAELGPRLDCRGTCVEVECSERVECLDANDICDVLNQCFPRTGACSAADTSPCPHFSNEVMRVATIECVDTRCQASQQSYAIAAGDGVPVIDVISPNDEDRLYQSVDEVVFRWVPASDTHIVLVTRAPPNSREDLGRLSLWGAVVTGGGSEVAWRDGHDIVDGAWLPTISDPPLATPLWLVVQAVAAADLSALSSAEPFGVGGTPPWAVAGDRCGDTDACASPVLPLLCVAGRCRVICGSDRDCVDAGLTFCRDPEDGARLCQ